MSVIKWTIVKLTCWLAELSEIQPRGRMIAVLCRSYTHHSIHPELAELVAQPPVLQELESGIAWGGQLSYILGIVACGPLVSSILVKLTSMSYYPQPKASGHHLLIQMVSGPPIS